MQSKQTMNETVVHNFTGVPPCEAFYGVFCTTARELFPLLWNPFGVWAVMTFVVFILPTQILDCCRATGGAVRRWQHWKTGDSDDEYDPDEWRPKRWAATRDEAARDDAHAAIRHASLVLRYLRFETYDDSVTTPKRMNELFEARQRAVDSFEALIRVRSFLRAKARALAARHHEAWGQARARQRLLAT